MVEVLGKLDWHAPEVEAAIYYCCREGLQNAMKRAGPFGPDRCGTDGASLFCLRTHHPVRMMSRLDP
jgi:hypothetical protein